MLEVWAKDSTVVLAACIDAHAMSFDQIDLDSITYDESKYPERCAEN